MNTQKWDFSDLAGDFDLEVTSEAKAKAAKADDDIDNDAAQPTQDNRQKYPCIRCSGTGTATWGHVRTYSGPCNVCKGRGFFLSSPAQRQKAQIARNAKVVVAKAEKEQDKQTWIAENKLIVDFLHSVKGWSNFAASLCDVINGYGSLTERQMAAATSMMLKTTTNKAKCDVSAPVLDLSKINKLFAHASATMKKPALYVGKVRLSLAPKTGSNPGCIYVKEDEQYRGKINAEGKWFPIRDTPAEILETLQKLAADPDGYMRERGRETGICCCCGRTLTNKLSIELGIGPICRESWGLV